MTADSYHLFRQVVEKEIGMELVQEYQFAKPRRWRSDFAIPELRIAIEIDGGIWTYGRHNRASSMLADMEKGNAYASRGWLALHFTPQNCLNTESIETIKQTVSIRKTHKNNL